MTRRIVRSGRIAYTLHIGKSETDLDELAGELAGELVQELRTGGWLKDPRLAEAFREVPRHRFIRSFQQHGKTLEPPWDERDLREIYRNQVLALKRSSGGGLLSSSSEPAIMAVMLEKLDLHEGHDVLEIGTGSGWNTGLIAYRTGPEGSVTSLDLERKLQDHARETLGDLGLNNTELLHRDGHRGAPERAPFHRVMVTAAAEGLFRNWAEQLRVSGVLVTPIRVSPGHSPVYRFFKERGDLLKGEMVSSAAFLPLTPQDDFDKLLDGSEIGRIAPALGDTFEVPLKPNGGG